MRVEEVQPPLVPHMEPVWAMNTGVELVSDRTRTDLRGDLPFVRFPPSNGPPTPHVPC